MDHSQERRWLVIDASHSGEMRFSAVEPSRSPRIGMVTTVSVEGVPTFTDALQKYERETGFRLDGADCALAMAGPTSGELLTMVRSRWTVTRGGMQAVFGRPVTILNDVAAMAWAARSRGVVAQPVRGSMPFSLERAGRMMMILVEEGVGGAIVDVDRDGAVRVLESEVGHMDFAPSSEREEKLAHAVRGMQPFASWERIITLDAADPAWAALPGTSDTEKLHMQAAIMGRFLVNLAHAYGAWQGVLLTGARAARLLSSGRTAFEGAFGQKRSFSRLVSVLPVWRLDQRDSVLLGAAELLAHKLDEASPGQAFASRGA